MITTKEVGLTKDILEEIRKIDPEVYKNISGRLVEMLTDRFKGKKICMMSVTEEGRRLAGHHFKHWMKLTDNVDVFISPM